MDCTVSFSHEAGPDVFVLAARRSLGGSLLWIFNSGSTVSVYPDCSAQVPCVYDSDARIAGSTALAVLSPADYDSRFDHPLFDKLGINGEGWLPAELTAHRGVFR